MVTGKTHFTTRCVAACCRKYRIVDFLRKLTIRDGYTCVVTRFQDLLHPNPNADVLVTGLDGAHILPRAISAFDKDHTSKSVCPFPFKARYLADQTSFIIFQFKSALTTFDILVKFTHLLVETLEDLHAEIDYPSNGMLLQKDAHDAFDRFDWCLKKTKFRFVALN